jgi:hypothetical protein
MWRWIAKRPKCTKFTCQMEQVKGDSVRLVGMPAARRRGIQMPWGESQSAYKNFVGKSLSVFRPRSHKVAERHFLAGAAEPNLKKRGAYWIFGKQ